MEIFAAKPPLSLWLDILADVREELGKERFNLWLGQVELLRFDEHRVEVGVPNAFARVCTEAHFRETLIRHCKERLGTSPEVVFLPAGSRAEGDACEGGSLAERFGSLAEQWRTETALASSVIEMCTHPAYQQIIGMGRAALPLILRELKSAPDHWFWALKAITGEDPVPPQDRGDVRAMREAWLEWGAKHGYEA